MSELAGHDAVRDRLAAYALGAVGAAEKAEIARHLRSCAECTVDHDRYRAVAAALAPRRDPVWDRVAETVAARRRDLDGFLRQLVPAGGGEANTAAPRVRVVVASDASTAQLTRRMDEDSRFAVVGRSQDVDQALSLAAERRPDLLVLALSRPDRGWLDTVAKVAERSPGTKVVLASGIEADSVAAMVVATSEAVAPPPPPTPSSHQATGRRCARRSIIDEAMWQIGITPRRAR